MRLASILLCFLVFAGCSIPEDDPVRTVEGKLVSVTPVPFNYNSQHCRMYLFQFEDGTSVDGYIPWYRKCKFQLDKRHKIVYRPFSVEIKQIIILDDAP